MYDLIQGIIEHSYTTGDSSQQYVYYICSALICILVIIFADAVRSVFHGFMFRSRK